MKVCYHYVFFNEKEDVSQRKLLEKAIASARRNIPGVEVWHVTDHDTRVVDGVDQVLRHTWTRDCFTVSRADAYALIGGDCLFMDTDTLIVRDVSEVFQKDFDVALAPRRADTGRYNQGVVFSRNAAFWMAVANRGREKGVYDELGFSEIVDSGRFKILQLSEAYNFAPCHDLAVLHFKGNRKQAMMGL